MLEGAIQCNHLRKILNAHGKIQYSSVPLIMCSLIFE